MKYLYTMLLFLPVTIIGKLTGLSDPLLFVFSSLSIIPLAGLMGKSTDVISCYAGQKIGGLLNATFGNATELIIAFIAMKEGMFDVVKASLAGSVIGNILLVLGMSMLVGGLKYKAQIFNKNSINNTASMLLFAVLGLSIPAIFTHTLPEHSLTTQFEGLSIIIAILTLRAILRAFRFRAADSAIRIALLGILIYNLIISAGPNGFGTYPRFRLSVSLLELLWIGIGTLIPRLSTCPGASPTPSTPTRSGTADPISAKP